VTELETAMRTFFEVQDAIADVDARLASIQSSGRSMFAAAGLNPDHLGAGYREKLTAGQRKAEQDYVAGAERLLAERAELLAEKLDAQHRMILENSRDPALVETGGADVSTPRKDRTVNPLTATRGDYERLAMAAITRFAGNHPASADRLDRVIRAESMPLNARYIAAVGDPDYLAAWTAVIASPDTASLELDQAERAALREARLASRALNVYALGTDAVDPGWPLPLQVDPTLILVGPGVEDPLRRLATVRTIVGRRLTVVTSASVTAAYGAEGTDVVEALPDPTPVEIKAERGAAFLRLTFELLGDLVGALGEIARIFDDAKTNLEAEKFAIGDGSDEPEGIFVGAPVFAGTPVNPTDLREVQSDLGPRYQPGARWLMNLAEANHISTFVASADADEPQIFDAQGRLLRKPVEEVSFAPDENVIYGDVRAGFTIVDRLGASIEPTGPHFNPETGVPSGSRGFLLLWRSGSKVVDPEALRLLAAGS
jgi:HK97 family phage major capsid protein